MKKITFFCAAALTVAIFVSERSLSAQDSLSQKSQMLDIKLQLLDSKLDLLDTKIKLWEAKPKELDNQLKELGSKISSLQFDPVKMNRKIDEIDSLYKINRKNAEYFEKMMDKDQSRTAVEAQPEAQPEFIPSYKSVISLDPVRLLEGTFSISYERILNQRFSANVDAMMTYSTKQGLSNLYFSNQRFELYNALTDSYENYTGEVMAGSGIRVQVRNYLLAGQPGRITAPLGLYAAPEVMYRHYRITGYSKQWGETEEGKPVLVDQRVVQNLDVVAAGAVLGYRLPLFKVLAIDVFVGGNIRLSKYFRESGFTKYKDMYNFDFSGVSPTAGISIGILK